MNKGCPIASDVDRLYAVRDEFVAKLQAKGSITVHDLRGLDRLGRCKVAVDSWAICTSEAREELLSDQHHQVRSCAVISQQQGK